MSEFARYLSAAPAPVVWCAPVNGDPVRDTSGAVVGVGVGLAVSGSWTASRPGFTVELCASPTGAAIAQARLKVATPTAITIGAAAFAQFPITGGLFIRVIGARRPWAKRWRRLEQAIGAAYADTFTEYMDGDALYTDQNASISPQANITAADGTPARLAGFADGAGGRDVSLSSVCSTAMAPSAAIASVQWDVGDGVITAGTSASAAIVARFPASTPYREIALTVTDTNGAAHTRVMPIWVHSAVQPPITAFEVLDDAREADGGRVMTLRLWGADGEFSPAALPEGAPLHYWDTDGDGMFGWALADAAQTQADTGAYTVTIGGAASWLDRLAAPARLLFDSASPIAWHELKALTPDRALHFALRTACNLLDLANFIPSGVPNDAALNTSGGTANAGGAARSIPSIALGRGTVWEQITAVAAANGGGVGVDGAGAILVRRRAEWIDEADRAAPVITLTPADWVLGALTIPQIKPPIVGAVEASGIDANGAAHQSRAPGVTTGDGAARFNLNGQALGDPGGARAELNRRAGHEYAWRSRARRDWTLALAGDLAVEPARRLPIAITAAGGARGVNLSSARFLIRRMQVEHANTFDNDGVINLRGGAPKRVTFTLDEWTAGRPGETIRVDHPTTPPPAVPGGDFPGSGEPPGKPSGGIGRARRTIAMLCSNNRLYRTHDFNTPAREGGPTWTTLDLSSLANWSGGALIGFSVDAFSPQYLGSGSIVNGWLCTTVGVQRITDIFGAPTLATGTTLGSPVIQTGRVINFERGRPDWGLVISYQRGVGTFAARTTDGQTWTETLITGHYDTFPNQHTPGLYISPHVLGTAYATAFTNTTQGLASTTALFKSTDDGATWVQVSNPNVSSGIAIGTIHVPYPSRDGSRVYSMRNGSPASFRRANGAADAALSPIVGGQPFFPWQYYLRSIATCDTEAASLVFVGWRAGAEGGSIFTTREADRAAPTWRRVSGPSAYQQAYIASDDRDVLYVIGGNAAIAYSDDFGVTLDSRRGNLTSETAPYSVGICGG